MTQHEQPERQALANSLGAALAGTAGGLHCSRAEATLFAELCKNSAVKSVPDGQMPSWIQLMGGPPLCMHRPSTPHSAEQRPLLVGVRVAGLKVQEAKTEDMLEGIHTLLWRVLNASLEHLGGRDGLAKLLHQHGLAQRGGVLNVSLHPTDGVVQFLHPQIAACSQLAAS